MSGSGINVELKSVDDLFSTEESRQDAAREKVMEIALSELYPFPDHPFSIREDDSMKETVESIKEYGVLSPAIARPRADGGYEIISGHRRKRACELAGLETMPVIVRDLDTDTATIFMVDSNLQRENILPMEKAKAYKMKLDALKRQGKRTDLTSRQVVGKLEAADEVGEKSGESGRQVQRFIRLTFLIKPLLDYVDEKKIPFNAGIELSYLEPEMQEQLCRVMERLCVFPSLAQAKKLKELGKEGKLDGNGIEIILSDEKQAAPAVKLQRKKLNEYFPADYSVEQMEEVIFDLLKRWRSQQGSRQEE